MTNSQDTGRSALVTGGGRGIGRAIARALGGAGVRVLVAARSEEELASVVAELESEGARAASHAVDLAAEGGAEAAVEAAVEAWGSLDILVNNAGIAPSARAVDTSEEEWERTLRLNLTVPFLTARAALPGMMERRWGRIINIASTAGKIGYPYTAAYTSSKHGLLGLTRALAAETSGTGVTVNAVCPGFTDTRLTEESVARIVEKTGRSSAEAREALEAQNPIGRLISPEEIARAVLFLVAEESEAIHGQAINVDGGAVTI